jgi:hypothetical protein
MTIPDPWLELYQLVQQLEVETDPAVVDDIRSRLLLPVLHRTYHDVGEPVYTPAKDLTP